MRLADDARGHRVGGADDRSESDPDAQRESRDQQASTGAARRPYVLIPIASATDEHIGILASLAEVLMEPASAERLRTTDSVDEVLTLLAPSED